MYEQVIKLFDCQVFQIMPNPFYSSKKVLHSNYLSCQNYSRTTATCLNFVIISLTFAHLFNFKWITSQ